MRSFNETLTNLLKKDSRFIDENRDLIRTEIINEALKIDRDLISLLLLNKKVKSKFFSEIEECWVFEMNKFIDYIQDKNLLQDSYTKYKNEIGLLIDNKFLRETENIVLSFPFKDCILEGGQTKEEEKRREIFFNEILAQDEIDRLLEPKVLTNFKRYIPKGKEKVTDFKTDENGLIRENLIIKGNNLLALYSIKKQYQGAVKFIYIDPPYNTGNDSFGYNDKFSHSTWLTFMKNRLEVVRDLLKEDGVLFVQINDTEHSYLKVLCDEIFDRENFHTSICVKMSHLSGVKMAHKEKKLPKIKEFILMYSKNGNLNLKPQYEPVTWDEALERYGSFLIKGNYGDEKCDKWNVISLNEALKINKINIKDKGAVDKFKLKNADLIFRTSINRSADYSHLPKDKFSRIVNSDGSYYFVYKREEVNFASAKVIDINGEKVPVNAIGDIWTDIGINNLSNEGGVDLRFGKKPEKLIKRLIDMTTKEGDIVLDYHLGSGTTCAVAHKMKRQYIGIEQLDYERNGSVIRLKNVIGKEKTKGKLRPTIEDYDITGISKEVNWKGGGNFIYCELARYNENFVEKIGKAKNIKELLKIFNEMKERSFINYNVNIKKVEENLDEFKKFQINKQKGLLISMLNKNQLCVNLSEINDSYFKISKDDKKLNKKFYNIENGTKR